MLKINKTFTEEDIANSSDFDLIEMKIYDVRNAIYDLGFTDIPTYTMKSWNNDDYLLYTYLNNIEEGIKNIGKYYFRPYGWQKTKTWAKGMGFSYRDFNRWINNINLVIDRLDNESNTLLPSDTLYPSDNLLPH